MLILPMYPAMYKILSRQISQESRQSHQESRHKSAGLAGFFVMFKSRQKMAGLAGFLLTPERLAQNSPIGCYNPTERANLIANPAGESSTTRSVKARSTHEQQHLH